MSPKKYSDATPGEKLLRLFRKLMVDGRRHYQLDLAKEFQCSTQTIIRMIGEIESVIGTNLELGIENRKRWYQLKPLPRRHLGLKFEELRYLSICRDLAENILPEQIRNRIDDTIFNLSVLMADDKAFAEREKAQKTQFVFNSKGRIDYTPHFDKIEKLVHAAEERRICLVRYKASGKQKDKEHRFAPGSIVAMSGALYAFGAGVTEDYQNMRHPTNMAIHRIVDVTLTDKRFAFALPEYDPATFGLPWHEPRMFRIRFKSGKTADYVRERIWADEQKMEEADDGGLLLSITTRSEPELLAWVRSFGEEARIETL